MNKEELVQKIISEMAKGKEAVDKEFIISWLKENYPSEEGLPEGYDKYGEMGRILDLAEKIGASEIEEEVKCCDSIYTLIYSLGLINSRKCKIDIFKLQKDVEIEELYKKYEA